MNEKKNVVEPARLEMEADQEFKQLHKVISMNQRFKSNIQKYNKVQNHEIDQLVGKNQMKLEKVKMHKKHEALAMREKIEDYSKSSKIREQEVEEKKQ